MYEEYKVNRDTLYVAKVILLQKKTDMMGR